EVRLRLTEIDGKAVDTPEKAPSCEAEAGAITSRIEGGVGSYCLSSIRRKENRRSPGPPFITSTLQQAASQSLSFSPSRTMRTAQELYEGVQLGRDGETSGLITYMRTDSVRLSPGSVRSCRDYIAERFGAGSLPPSPRRFRASKAAQDAHEAIRPVDVRMDPESLGKWLTSDQAKLYSLIWRRFIATQMAPALIVSTTVLVSGADGLIFKARGELVAEPGFLAVDPSQITTEKPLPELEKGPVELIEVLPELRTTRPPTRFSEAGLVAEMKNKGIGRPSTYVPIIDKIKQRKYVQLEGGRLIPTELGTTVLRLLVELFPYIFEIGFTSDMEGLLDDIAEGKIAYADALGRLNTPLESSLAQAMANLDRVRERLSEETDERCPVCGAPLKVRWGRFGRFMACSAFPDCRFTRPLDDGEESSRFESRVCPECGGKGMLVRNGRYGRYLACSNASSCRHTEPYPTGASCPEEGCDGELVERKSKRGKLFYSCSNYPSCRFATWNEPVAVVCPRCGYPFLERRKRGGIYCPRCKKKIQLEKSRPGTSADS
ncbi:topoisomerase DNA-binding C4 zinc finger domain-containing protein, partial [Candidatus Fermentibacterales bacterium]|nr:topoisomerase DNA-binding C4 zinc finger domain-containing protein [Candidatus Fermentibacterales bacterium]